MSTVFKGEHTPRTAQRLGLLFPVIAEDFSAGRWVNFSPDEHAGVHMYRLRGENCGYLLFFEPPPRPLSQQEHFEGPDPLHLTKLLRTFLKNTCNLPPTAADHRAILHNCPICCSNLVFSGVLWTQYKRTNAPLATAE